MSLDIIKYGFSAGEISPSLYGRSDLTKYDLACARAQNSFVNYRGGLDSRMGTQFIDYVYRDDLDTKFITFKFAPNVNQTYVLLFGHNYIRFIQNGAYILELPVAITGGITNANPGIVTAAAHGFANGDWVKPFNIAGMTELNADTFQVSNVTTNTFQLNDHTGAAVDTTAYGTYVSGGSFYRIYTLATPYASTDLATLKAFQSKSLIRLTSNNFQPRSLLRISDTNWTLTPWLAVTTLAAPTGVTLTPSAAASAGVAFTVTAVDAFGNESLPAKFAFNSLSVNYTTTAGSMKVTWTPVVGAVSYKIYRSTVIPVGADINRAVDVGYLGRAYGPSFTDNNIIPDFTQTPPLHLDPFANAAIQFIAISNGGTGYTNLSVVTASGGGGTGFEGYAVQNGGILTGIVVVNGGSGYVSPTISVTVGTGGVFTTTLSPATGNYPAVSNVFQQRWVYAATLNDPLGLWGSSTGQFDNFNDSIVVKANDSYQFDLDAQEVAPIQHIVTTRSGMAIFTRNALWQLEGNASNVVTPLAAIADPQSFIGANAVPPIAIDIDLLYIEGKGSTVRLITYTAYTRVYSGQDLSILASHLMNTTNLAITKWDYASDPYKIVHAVRADGAALALTLVKEQNVFAWTPWTTKGLYKDVCVVQENSSDTVYFLVQRFIKGRWSKYIERQAQRTFVNPEDAWCVDGALALGATYPASTLQPAANTGKAVNFIAGSPVFSAPNVGSIIRVGGGKAVITAYISSTSVTCDYLRDMTNVVAEDPLFTPIQAQSGEWTMDTPVLLVSGLRHLEGQTISILGDGDVLTPQVVTNGKVTLSRPCTRVIAGLGFTCIFASLPPSISGATIEGKRQRPVGLALRTDRTRGLKYGTKLTNLYDIKERTNEKMGEPTNLQSGVKLLNLPSGFNLSPTIYLVQVNPLPVSILGFVLREDIGDDSRANN
jgi:hypothetical protein